MINKLNAFGSNDSLVKDVVKSAGKTAAFGIDLGTTNSAISVVVANDSVDTLPVSSSGRKTMPSCVMWTGNGREFIVGEEAYKNRAKENVIYSVKTLMQNPAATVTLRKEGKELIMTPTEVSAEILKALVQKAGSLYGEIKDVVVTLPAYFMVEGVAATRKACELAGLNVLGILREPTAASLCYKTETQKASNVLVYDLGGGTFDCSLIHITNVDSKQDMQNLSDIYGFDDSTEQESSNELEKHVQVIDTSGDSHLGGDDYDKEIYKVAIQKIKEEFGDFNEESIPVGEREELILRLENYKKRDINQIYEIHYEFHLPSRTLEGSFNLYPSDFVVAFDPIFKRADKIVTEMLRRVDPIYAPDSIVLVGGSTKNPILKDKLRSEFPFLKIEDAYNPDESVAQGAAIYAKRIKFGASNVQVFDILPIALGIKEGDVITHLIKRGSSLPVTSSENFTTSIDNQERVYVRVYQGDSMLPDQCSLLGTITIDDIKPAKAGSPSLQVKLSVSVDGLLTCKAVIDDVEREIQISLNSTEKAEISKEQKSDKAVGRWTQFANALEDGVAKDKLLYMISRYPVGTSRQEIVKFISENRKV